MTNRVIDQYEIKAILGRGAMGKVYKVLLPETNQIAALKEFHPSPNLVKKTGLTFLKELFVQETNLIKNIRHPNIVKIYDLEETTEHLFYTMEYFSRNLGLMMGESYWADSPSRRIPIAHTRHYMTGILKGLSELHDAGIIHRDIKPFNILLTHSGIVKIVDFGLSKRRGERSAKALGELNIGSPFYSGPEQLMTPEKADHRADLYSAGIILYRMLTGQLPREKIQWASHLNPYLDSSCDDFISKAIHSNPERRFQSASAMLSHLDHLYDALDKKRILECEFEDNEESDPRNSNAYTHHLHIRSEPERVLKKHARERFQLNGLNQPRQYVTNQFQMGEKFDDKSVLLDHSTDLIWQANGSSSPVTWEEAHQYVGQLSETGVGGYSTWRLPTVTELLTLLDPGSVNPHCDKRHFSDVQKWIWSADTRSKKSAWMVDLEMGYVTSFDRSDSCYVRAVSSM